ncbi:CS1 type fimbrial major subunit [Chromobacterium haemolyticum]|uniref:CS1 type fimbrial major subunit n=1 Tax=Chromobacterium haemolyticum TaxID=394935 RepID=UPI00307E4027
MTIRKTLIAATLAIASGSVLAETQPLTFQVEAEVKNDTFLIQPQGDWHTTATQLTWRPDLDKLEPVTKKVYVKSSIGAISAYLDSAPRLSSGGNNVPLTINLGDAEMGVGAANKVEIAAEATAAFGTNVPLKIDAPTPTGGLKPGNYTGAVNLTFESLAP